MYIVILYLNGKKVGQAEFKTVDEAQAYSEKKKLLGYEVGFVLT